MRKILFCLHFTALSVGAYSQMLFSDTITFEKGSNLVHIDTSQKNNIWQIGTPHKSFFDSAYSKPYAIVTDTIGAYPINNTSSFVIDMPYGGLLGDMVSFWYKIETDSLFDGGYIELSTDTGKTWTNIANAPGCSCNNIYNYGTITGGVPALTGRSDGWQNMSFLLGCKEFGLQDSLLLRFTFKSGSVVSNKEGWLIDNINVIVGACEGVDEINNKQASMSIYPMPANNNVTITYQLSLPNTKAELKLCNAMGQLVSSKSINSENTTATEDVSVLPNGVYYYALVVNGSVAATTKLVIVR